MREVDEGEARPPPLDLGRLCRIERLGEQLDRRVADVGAHERELLQPRAALDGRPDAYVFTREAVRAADLRVVRTYRLVNPAATKRASSEPALKRSGSSQRAVGAAGFA